MAFRAWWQRERERERQRSLLTPPRSLCSNTDARVNLDRRSTQAPTRPGVWEPATAFDAIERLGDAVTTTRRGARLRSTHCLILSRGEGTVQVRKKKGVPHDNLLRVILRREQKHASIYAVGENTANYKAQP